MTQAILGLWALALVLIAVRRPDRLLAAAVVCSVFPGAALVNAGGLGVSPYYFTLMLIAARCGLVRVTAGTLLGRTEASRRVIGCCALLLAIGLGSAVVLPRVFAGVPVLSPRLATDTAAPLVFSTSNLGQGVYLGLNVLMLWYAAQTCRTPDQVRGLVRSLLVAGGVVIAFAAYQLASTLAGLPFPDEVLYSNQSYVMQNGTAVLNMPRICSTFTEPASVATFLLPFLVFVARRLETPVRGGGGGRWPDAALLAGTVACLILSTSSTAYVGLGGVAAWAGWRHFLRPAFTGRGSVRAGVTVAAVVAVVAIAVASNATLRDMIQHMVFDKTGSSSYEERSSADAYSFGLVVETLGLGTGLGSNRASSLLPGMLSTIGVFGVATLALLVVFLLARPTNAVARLHHPSLSVALMAALGAMLLCGPDLSTPCVWVIMLPLVAGLAVPGGDSDAPRRLGAFTRAVRPERPGLAVTRLFPS